MVCEPIRGGGQLWSRLDLECHAPRLGKIYRFDRLAVLFKCVRSANFDSPMKIIDIDLWEPFERNVERALALPTRQSNEHVPDKEVLAALQRLYELVHGRFVQTTIGIIPVAPPVAPEFGSTRLCVATRTELLQALNQQIAMAYRKQTGITPHFAPADQRDHKPSRQTLPAKSTDKRRTMKNIPIHITPHDLDLSPAVRDFLQKKLSGVARFAGDVLAAEVVLRGRSGAAARFSVSARLALPGRDVQANATHGNLYGAIDKLVSRLGRLSRKRKTRLAKVFRRPGGTRIKRVSDVRGYGFAT